MKIEILHGEFDGRLPVVIVHRETKEEVIIPGGLLKDFIRRWEGGYYPALRTPFDMIKQGVNETFRLNGSAWSERGKWTAYNFREVK